MRAQVGTQRKDLVTAALGRYSAVKRAANKPATGGVTKKQRRRNVKA